MDAEQRATQRELLRARAALERVQLAEQLALLSRPLGPGRLASVARLKASTFSRTSLLRLAATAVALVRRQPTLLSVAISLASRFRRLRILRWALLAGGVAYVAWSVARESGAGDEAADEMSNFDPDLGRS
jgi:hypothetical protein